MGVFGEVNVATLDWPWSFVHLMSGSLIGLGLLYFRITTPRKKFWLVGFGVLALWELVEVALRYFDIHAHDTIAPLKQAVGGFAFAPESAANIIGDLGIGSGGLFFGRRLRKYFLHDRAGR